MTTPPETGPEVKRYRKRPITTEAVQLVDDPALSDPGWEAIAKWCGGHLRNYEIADSGEYDTHLLLLAEDGDSYEHGVEGDYIVKDHGEFLIMEPDIFAATYEPADAADPAAAERERIAKLAEELDATYSPRAGADSGIAFSFADLIREGG